MEQQPAVELGAMPEVRAIAKLSKSEIARRVKAKTFPQPVRLGPRCTRWNLVEVRAWAADRLAVRGNPEAEARVFAENRTAREQERQRKDERQRRKQQAEGAATNASSG